MDPSAATAFISLLTNGGPAALLAYFIYLLMKGSFVTRDHYDAVIKEKDNQITRLIAANDRLEGLATSGTQLAQRAVTATVEGAAKTTLP